jgi:flagellar assembly factor FliW
MNLQPAVARSEPLPVPPSYVEIDTRFGRVSFKEENAIAMPGGLPGFPGRRRFGLSPLPNPRFEQFVLFQDLDDPSLCFLVMPVPVDSGLVEAEDVDEALASCGIAREDATFLLIVTLRKEDDGVVTTVNLRAPIILDTDRKVARQYVMPNGKYAIRHVV